jgi:iron-sulfur cluster assembly protein
LISNKELDFSANIHKNIHLLNKIMVTVTEIAKNKIIELRSKDGLEGDLGVRVAVEGGGCSGLMYDLQFDGEQRPTDHIFEDKGIKVFVDKKSLLYLIGTELDFSDGLNGKGFQFKNPNATRTCGCGESFSV